MKKLRVFIAICVILVIGSSMAYAGTTLKSYSTTVGKVNGNGYTSYQTKAVTKASGVLESEVVGSKYKVDARMQSEHGIIGAWVRDVGDNDTRSLPSHVLQEKGHGIRVQFSNDLDTPVDVQVEGKWKSN